MNDEHNDEPSEPTLGRRLTTPVSPIVFAITAVALAIVVGLTIVFAAYVGVQTRSTGLAMGGGATRQSSSPSGTCRATSGCASWAEDPRMAEHERGEAALPFGWSGAYARCVYGCKEAVSNHPQSPLTVMDGLLVRIP